MTLAMGIKVLGRESHNIIVFFNKIKGKGDVERVSSPFIPISFTNRLLIRVGHDMRVLIQNNSITKLGKVMQFQGLGEDINQSSSFPR